MGPMRSIPHRFSIVLLAVVFSACENEYQRGYERGYGRGTKEGYTAGYREGYDEGAAVRAQTRQPADGGPAQTTVSEKFFAGRGPESMFTLFSFLNMLIVLGGSLYLVLNVKDPAVQVGKALVYVIGSYVWFRFLQRVLVENDLFPAAGGARQLVIELLAFLLALSLVWSFDVLYVKRRNAPVWLDCVGILVCTVLFFLFLHYYVNRALFLTQADALTAVRVVAAFSLGGLAYTSYAMIRKGTRRARSSDAL